MIEGCQKSSRRGSIRKAYGKLILVFGCVTPQTHSERPGLPIRSQRQQFPCLSFGFLAFYDLRVFNYNYRAMQLQVMGFRGGGKVPRGRGKWTAVDEFYGLHTAQILGHCGHLFAC